jgi:hypothetical protein
VPLLLNLDGEVLSNGLTLRSEQSKHHIGLTMFFNPRINLAENLRAAGRPAAIDPHQHQAKLHYG